MAGRKGGTTIQIEASAGRGKFRVCASCRLLGSDALIAVWGGTKPHIGSAAIAQPRLSGKSRASLSTTSSVYNLPGHKDEAASRLFAEKVSAALNKTVVAVAGIHIDDATQDDIGRILQNIELLCARLIKKLSGESLKEAV